MAIKSAALDRAPKIIRGPFAGFRFAQFIVDPLETVRRLYDQYGPLVSIGDPLPLPIARITFVLAIGSRFNREILGKPAMWRPSAISPGGPRDSAARRLMRGIISMTGREHEHYRRLLSVHMQRKNVEDLGERMAELAADEVAQWPVGTPVNLSALVQQLLMKLSIGLMFGGDHDHGVPIADKINRYFADNWDPKLALCPFDLPGTPFARRLRNAEELERAILAWAGNKRKNPNNRDLLSVIVNNSDENGAPPSDAKIVGHVPTLFGATYENCQETSMWTLLLLNQHPQIARDLVDELRSHLRGAAPTLARIGKLPLLDRVIKESMRVLPPVPHLFRKPTEATMLEGIPIGRRGYVLLSPFLTNRNPDLYEDAERYKPERWENINPTPFEYSVFGAGPRACIGYWLGMAMLKTVIATILVSRRPALEPGAKIDYILHVALAPRRPILATLSPQDMAFTAAPIGGRIRKLVQLPN